MVLSTIEMTKLWILLMGISQITRVTNSYNPHEPMIWQLINGLESKVIQEYKGAGHNWNFTVYLFDFISFDDNRRVYQRPYYICPASNPGKSYCNAPNHYFCAYWGCETIASSWTTRGDPYLHVQWGPPGCIPPKYNAIAGQVGQAESCRKSPAGCNHCIRLEIKVKNPEDTTWEFGRTWGIRIWEPGTDRGSIFRIIRQNMPHDPSPAIGPNKMLNKFVQETQTKTSIQTRMTTHLINPSTSPLADSEQKIPFEAFDNSLWSIMHAAYLALNNTQPNLTNECWLCYSIKPPYYEAIGHPRKVQWKNGTNPPECPWNRNLTQGITIQQVTGKGKCVGTVPEQYVSLCNNTIPKAKIESKRNNSIEWLIPDKGAKWVCSDVGVTPCISLKVFDPTQFCVQVIIVPRLMYHSNEEIIYQMENSVRRQKREPLTVITLAALLVAGGVGAGTGIASIVKTDEIQSLQKAVDEDLERIEQSIDSLATSVKSLSEVVLQNRRGLDLVFLKEGGLCVSLQEECCSFIDHTGMVKNSMAELQKRLEKRKRDRELGRTWYEGWFNMSPWLTTLLSALAGPLILMFLICLLGPCILRCLRNFIEKRFETTKLLILAAPKNEYKDDIQPPSIKLEERTNI